MYFEKRIVAERDPCLIEAHAHIRENAPPVACLIRDISEHGACVELATEADVPSRFVLALPVDGDIVDRRDVELRWRHEQRFGVRFLPR